MCQPVRYVYPTCGHPVDLDEAIWTLERCRFALCCNRDCWIPNDVPEHMIEEKPWPYDELTEPCYMPHELQDDLNDIATVASTDSSDAEDQSSLISLVEVMSSAPTTPEPEPEELDEKEIDRRINQILFGVAPAEPDTFVLEDKLELDGDDFILPELSLNEEELRKYEATLAEASSLSEETIVYFTKVIAQTAEELSFAGVEDNIEWEKVQVVEAPLELGHLEDEMDIDGCFENWLQ
ncbi:hypothetical protein NW768_000847 [Fusarium equiseti]|uniref:Uncharacterized protein n=1 Tax=Fusarium equiseti TaxID=61235 RepID=A0ABQ8RTP3_FUSEQ|nr:hypothetical protein NW768_000847 [Fusarium equiseti]